jgi:hypothetical protein
MSNTISCRLISSDRSKSNIVSVIRGIGDDNCKTSRSTHVYTPYIKPPRNLNGSAEAKVELHLILDVTPVRGLIILKSQSLYPRYLIQYVQT